MRISQLRRFASAVILEITYGHKVESDDDAYLKLSDELGSISADLRGAGPVIIDFIPICALL